MADKLGGYTQPGGGGGGGSKVLEGIKPGG